MQAIRTRYLGPTDTRGSRIQAKCSGGTVTVSYDAALDSEGNHAAACRKLAGKMGWPIYPAFIPGVFESDTYWVPGI